MFSRTPRVAPRAAAATLCAEVGDHRRAVEPRRASAWGKAFEWTTRPGRPASTPRLTGARRGTAGAGGRPIGIRATTARKGRGTDMSGPTYAALDLGTNNCRLLVARATRDGFRVIDAFSRIIRLGEGVTASGRLSEAAIVRAVEALRVCRAKMRNRGVTRARLIATEACRAAANGARFPRSRARRRSASSSRSSIARPRRGSPPPAARRWSIRRPRA